MVTTICQQMEFDPDKDAANLRKHGVSLAKAASIDFVDALIERSDRPHDPEPRYLALVEHESRVWAFVFVDRRGEVRALSLRPARRDERERYAQRS